MLPNYLCPASRARDDSPWPANTQKLYLGVDKLQPLSTDKLWPALTLYINGQMYKFTTNLFLCSHHIQAAPRHLLSLKIATVAFYMMPPPTLPEE